MKTNWIGIYSKLLSLIFLCTVTLWIVSNYVQVNESTNLLFIITYIGFLILSGVLSLASSTHLSIQAKSWSFGSFLIGLGLISWGIAEFVWFYYERFLFIEMPYPSLADVLYMSFYPFMICGLIPFIMDVRDKIFSKRRLLVVAILLILLVVGGVYTVLAKFPPSAMTSETLKSIFDTSYVVWDAVLLIVLVILMGYVLVSSQNYKKYVLSLVIICVGSFLLLIADVLFAYISDTDSYTQGNYLDLIYLVSSFCIGIATIKFSEISANNLEPVVK